MYFNVIDNVVLQMTLVTKRQCEEPFLISDVSGNNTVLEIVDRIEGECLRNVQKLRKNGVEG